MLEMSDPSRTTFLALAVLHDAIERARDAHLRPPEHGVRLALAYLYSISLRKDREPFDMLWRTLLTSDTDPRRSFRLTAAGTEFGRICNAVDVQQDIALTTALARVRAGR